MFRHRKKIFLELTTLWGSVTVEVNTTVSPLWMVRTCGKKELKSAEADGLLAPTITFQIYRFLGE